MTHRRSLKQYQRLKKQKSVFCRLDVQLYNHLLLMMMSKQRFFIIRLMVMIRFSFLTLTIGDINHLIRRVFHTELFFGLSKGQDTLQYCAFDQMVVCPGLWYRSPPSSQEANWKHGQGFHSRTAKRATGISGLSYSAPCAVQLPACQKVPGPQ